MPGRSASPVFVGRDNELAVLDAALRRAVEDEPALVIAGGEAGVGKTRLLEEFADRTRADGARVLVGGCVELGEEGMPFAPVVTALRALLREAGREGLEHLLPGARAELAPLLPELGPALAMPGEAGRGRLFEVIGDLIERLGHERPLVLVLEDLQWADRSTRELVAFLARAVRSSAVLIVGTYRSDELHRGHPLRPFIAELDRLRSVQRFELDRFDATEVGQQLAGILGHQPTPLLVSQVFSRSEGNAFFVEELVCGTREAGESSVVLTSSLRDLLLARVDRLSPTAQHVLRVASAGRSQVDYLLLAAVVDLTEDDLLAALREAVSDNVLAADGDGFCFRHSLLREVLHDDLLPGEHGRLHLRYAEVLESQPALVPSDRLTSEVAHHWHAAGEPARGLPAALAAAADAGDRYAYAEQRAMLERALELWERVSDPVGLAGIEHLRLIELAVVAATRAGDHDRALALNDVAIAECDPAEDPERAALLHERRGKLLRDLSRDGGLAALRRAEELVADRPTRARAVVLASLAGALMLKPQVPESLAAGQEALALARTLGERSVEVSVLTTIGCDQVMLGQVDTGLGTLQEALVLAESLGPNESLLRARANYSDALHGLGRHADAADMARAGVDLARRIGLARTMGAFLINNLAEPLYAQGQWDEAGRLVSEALALDPPGVQAAPLHLTGAGLATRRGLWAESEEHLAGARGAIARRHVGAQYLYPLAQVSAELALWRGDPQAACDGVLTRLTDRPARGDERFAWPLAALAARAAADLTQRARDVRDDDAAASAERVVGAVREVVAGLGEAPGVVVAAWAATTAAELSRADSHAVPGGAAGDPRAAWAAAVDAWETASEPYPLAYARFRLAEALAQAGDRERAAGNLTAAIEVAGALRATPLAHEIELLARRARIEVPRWRRSVPAARAGEGRSGSDDVPAQLGLTPREREVLRGVAAGRSNRQIAEELFISAKTVSVHVSNILAKLHVSGRGEAAALAHRLRLFDEVSGAGSGPPNR